LATPVWFIILAVFWHLRKRALLREGKPLAGTVSELPHPLDEAK